MNSLPGPIYVCQQSRVYQQLTQTLKLFDQMVDYMNFFDKDVVQTRLKKAVKKGVNMNGAPLETLDLEFSEVLKMGMQFCDFIEFKRSEQYTWMHTEHDGPRPPPTEPVTIESVIGQPVPEPEPSPPPPNYSVPYQMVSPMMVSPEAVSPQTVSPQTVPSQTVSPQTVSPQTVPSQTVSPQTVSPQTVPSETVSPQTVPPQTVPSQTVPPQTIPPHLVPAQTIPGRTVYYHGYVAVTNYVPSYLVVTRPITSGQPATAQVVPLQDIPGFTPSTHNVPPSLMPNQTIAFINPLNQNNNQDESNQNMTN
ncbi:hypothetical protein RDWZM_010421 [Blomia tropicalis]|uniref:Uncharacterized protein n=1 Tax=Blomia tropicalis TaxID=40697 RepID=A0A9Q0RK34_BLOTA|nr:hypothetical protein RDWZM_010421 [Blomia tropicalis]